MEGGVMEDWAQEKKLFPRLFVLQLFPDGKVTY